MNIKEKFNVGLIVAGVSLFSGFGGHMWSKIEDQNSIKELEKRVEVLELTKKNLKHENYQLHLDLIKRDNPYDWELFRDELGSWGYRRADDGASTLGSTNPYICLRTE